MYLWILYKFRMFPWEWPRVIEVEEINVSLIILPFRVIFLTLDFVQKAL